MSINIMYRVEVTIPENVYREFGHTREYEQMSLTACSDSFESGQNSYSSVELWAIFDNDSEARMCEKMIYNMIEYFQGKFK